MAIRYITKFDMNTIYCVHLWLGINSTEVKNDQLF